METNTVKPLSELKKENQDAITSAEKYFLEIKNAKTIEDLGSEPEKFELWCYWKHQEVKIKAQIAEDLEANPDLQSIAKCLTTYAPDLSWVISQQQIIARQLKKIQDGRDHWYNDKHLKALRALKEQGNSAPAIKSINAYIEQNYTSEWNEWEDAIDSLYRKELVLDKHVTLWMKLDKVFSSLIYDLNSEFWRSYKKYSLPGEQGQISRPQEIPKQLLDQYEEDSFNSFITRGTRNG